MFAAADHTLNAACNWAAGRPWALCAILCASILLGCWLEESL